MTEKTPAERKQADEAAEFFYTMIKMIKKHQEMVTESVLSNAALLSSVALVDPKILQNYERELTRLKTDSPFARQSRQIKEELDRLTAKMQLPS